MLVAISRRQGQVDMLARDVLMRDLFLAGYIAPHSLQVIVLVLHEGCHATGLFLDSGTLIGKLVDLPHF